MVMEFTEQLLNEVAAERWKDGSFPTFLLPHQPAECSSECPDHPAPQAYGTCWERQPLLPSIPSSDLPGIVPEGPS